MEFETQTAADRSLELTDDQRIAAAARQVTLTPLHEDTAPDDLPDALIANQHILNAPIANIDTDTEVTTAAATQAATKRSHRVALGTSLSIVAILSAITIYALFFRQ